MGPAAEAPDRNGDLQPKFPIIHVACSNFPPVPAECASDARRLNRNNPRLVHLPILRSRPRLVPSFCPGGRNPRVTHFASAAKSPIVQVVKWYCSGFPSVPAGCAATILGLSRYKLRLSRCNRSRSCVDSFPGSCDGGRTLSCTKWGHSHWGLVFMLNVQR
jgi:hypothetical protein